MKKPPKKAVEISNEQLRVKIIASLENKEFSMRTLKGIAKETNSTEQRIKAMIVGDKTLAKEIKYMPFRSSDGKLLVTSKGRFAKEASFKVKFIDFFATRRQGVKDEE